MLTAVNLLVVNTALVHHREFHVVDILAPAVVVTRSESLGTRRMLAAAAHRPHGLGVRGFAPF